MSLVHETGVAGQTPTASSEAPAEKRSTNRQSSGSVTSLASHRRTQSGKKPRRFLVVVCHPVPTSFIHSLAERSVAALETGGHEVRVLDLYADDFGACLTRDEWRDRANAASWPQLRTHIELLRWADGLVFVYPTWFGGQPAMLKGWFDRVWCEGVAYRVPKDGGRVRGLLTNIASIDVVTTHGSGKFMNAIQGEPGKRVLLRGLRSMCGLRCRSSWIAFYGNDRAVDSDRFAFLDRVSTELTKR
jgi:NAD(P)H dehydrogenase (quinone)